VRAGAAVTIGRTASSTLLNLVAERSR
jgi:hypothetical protein